MRRLLACVTVFLFSICLPAFASCSLFTGSTMTVPGYVPAAWRTDYPAPGGPVVAPWEQIDFQSDPQGYMLSVLADAEASFSRSGTKLVGTGTENWWIAEWLDYMTSGREPLMGLTKERGPDSGDLSPTNGDGYQVWAVGFYNAPGASTLGSIFADPCAPTLPAVVDFPQGTVSVKFLFTDADPTEVTYLAGAPTYEALIDEAGVGSASRPAEDRQKRDLRLLQVDISVKDSDATDTGWVFGTFGWVGPSSGDGLFDNLVPVALQWGNDPGVYSQAITQSWVNPALAGKMYGWAKRPTLGFQGRANGPADNIRSSCLSCHAAARVPRSTLGILGFSFNMNNVNDPTRVKPHVDTWFENIMAGSLFRPQEPAVSALDYSLQLDAAMFRMCRACDAGALTGPTPGVCIAAKLFEEPKCTGTIMPLEAGETVRRQQIEFDPPPRQ